MNAARKRSDALRLVHPGKHVEILQAPITAGEIMERYPRHCVARPDVFENPWISVHPRSFLSPGETFYLVPFHTMNTLMKAKAGESNSCEARGKISTAIEHRRPRAMNTEVRIKPCLKRPDSVGRKADLKQVRFDLDGRHSRGTAYNKGCFGLERVMAATYMCWRAKALLRKNLIG